MRRTERISANAWIGAIAALLLCLAINIFSVVHFTYSDRDDYIFGTQGYLDWDSDIVYALAYPLHQLGWQFPTWIIVLATMVALFMAMVSMKSRDKALKWLVLAFTLHAATIVVLFISWNLDYAEVQYHRGQGWQPKAEVFGMGAYALALVPLFIAWAWASRKRQLS